MNAKLISELASLDPKNTEIGLARRGNVFRHVYLNPEFGWHIANAFAHARMAFPGTLIGRNHWVVRAYMNCLDPVAYHDCDVESAYRLSRHTTSAMLRALIIAGLDKPVESHLALVAEKACIPGRTVEAFEILFFNVLDRHQDGAYLSNIVYPHGRQVEFDEDYFNTTPIPELILRAAYNYRDTGLVLRLAGMDDASCVKELAALRDSEAEAELQRRIMSNALTMTQLGMLNQRNAGLQRATTLLNARRSSRNQTQIPLATPETYDLSAELAAALAALPPITASDLQDLKAAFHPGRSYCSDEAGTVFTIGDPADSANLRALGKDSEPITRFPEPITAMWRNRDFDKPVTLVALMSEPGFPDHYLTDDNTGVPVSQVYFEKLDMDAPVS